MRAGTENTADASVVAGEDATTPVIHDHGFCPVAATLNLLHGKWTLHIVHALLGGKTRFNELGGALGGVNPRTLRERLRGLEAEGIVQRTVKRTIPPWVEYELTEKGRALGDVMDAMSHWAQEWVEPPSSC
jgi:DNA-binding HxlR family transcriptional regulator